MVLPWQARATPVSTVVGGLSSGAAYAKGLWVRLNGGGRRGGGNAASGPLPYQLPAPVATRAQRAAAIAALSKDIDALEQKLQEASKVRAADHITHLCVSVSLMIWPLCMHSAPAVAHQLQKVAQLLLSSMLNALTRQDERMLTAVGRLVKSLLSSCRSEKQRCGERASGAALGWLESCGIWTMRCEQAPAKLWKAARIDHIRIDASGGRLGSICSWTTCSKSRKQEEYALFGIRILIRCYKDSDQAVTPEVQGLAIVG